MLREGDLVNLNCETSTGGEERETGDCLVMRRYLSQLTKYPGAVSGNWASWKPLKQQPAEEARPGL